MPNRLNILGVGFDYKSIKEPQIRGDFKERLLKVSNYINCLTRIVFSPQDANLSQEMIANNIQIIYTNSKNKMFFIKDAINITGTLLKNKSIDVVTAEDPFLSALTGWFIKRKFNLPFNVQINDNRVGNIFWLRERKKNCLMNEMSKFVLKRADTLRVVSEHTKRCLIEMGITSKKIFVVPTVVSVDKFQNVNGNPIREKYLDRGFDKIILFVGRLSFEKDIPTLLKSCKLVFAKHPKILLLIVGSGPEEYRLKQYVSDLEIERNVIFAGAVEYNQIPEYFACADIVVLTSLHEGRANVLVEAALSKKPIIATKAGDVPDYILDEKTGYIVNIGDYGLLAEKIDFLFSNPEKINKLGSNAYKYIIQKLEKYNDLKLLIDCWEKTKWLYEKNKNIAS